MNKMVMYKAGYTVRVVSCENDADNYQTNEIYMHNDRYNAHFVRDLALLFKSKNDWNNPGIGNIYGDYAMPADIAMVEKALREHLDKHGTNTGYTFQDLVDIAVILGLMNRTEYYTRVCAEAAIMYTAVDLELEVIE